MLVWAIVIVWVAAAALFWVAFTGLELRFAIARRKHTPEYARSAIPDPTLPTAASTTPEFPVKIRGVRRSIG